MSTFLSRFHTLHSSFLSLLSWKTAVRFLLSISIATGAVLTSFLALPVPAHAANHTSSQPNKPSSHSPAPTSIPPLKKDEQGPPRTSALHPSNTIKPYVSTLSPYDGLGDLPFYTYITLKINDRTEVKVNVANGNLLFHSTSLHVKGTGIDLGYDLYYNSQTTYNYYTSEYASNWTSNLCATQYLDLTNPDTGIIYYGPSNFAAYFAHTSNGSYTDAPGINAHLQANGDGTYTLTYYQTGERITFGTDWSVSKLQDKNNNTISCTYDFSQSKKRSSTITDTQGRVTTITHDNLNRVSYVYDSNGRTFSYSYDPNHQLSGIKDTLQKQTSLGYTGNDLTSITDPLRQQTAISYFSGHRVNQITDATGTGTISFTYNNGSTIVTDQNGHSTTYTYNGNLQVITTTDALGHASQKTFDATTYNVSKYSDALSDFSTFQFSQDGRNNLTSVTNGQSTGSNLSQGTTTTYRYSAQGSPDVGENLYSPLSQTDPQNHVTQYAYDHHGNLLSAIDQTSNKGLTSTYNPNGTVASQQDANGKITTYGYDNHGNLTSIIQPAPLGQTTITLDGLSRVSTLTDGNNHQTTSTYDDLDRLVTITYYDGSTITYTYDDNGNLLTEADSTGTTTFQFDALNRVIQKHLPGGTIIATAYDQVGNLTSYNDGTGAVTYSYDNANRVTTLNDPDGAQTLYGYDNTNHKTSIRYPNGTGMVMTFDTAGHELTNQSGVFISSTSNQFSTLYSNYHYHYQAGSNQTALLQQTTALDPVTQSGTLTRTYSYDSLDRLLEAAFTDASNTKVDDYRYSYDSNSNILSKQVQSTGLNESYAYNDASELTTKTNGSGSTTYSYDGIGNLTGSTNGAAVSYNARNQSTRIGSDTYTYSGTTQADRVQVNGDSFVYGGLGLTSTTTTAGTTAYVRCSCGLLNSERTPDGQKYYYLFDGLGSIIGMTDSTGNDVNRYDYDPFGNLLNQQEQAGINNPWKYAGGYLDSSTGLYKYGIRYYDPTLGRWTQRTPVGGSLAETLKANPYVYADNNPVNEVDPSGKDAITVGEILCGGGAIAGVLALAAATYASGGLAAVFALAGVKFLEAAIGGCVVTVLSEIVTQIAHRVG